MLSLWFGYSLGKMKAVIIELTHWNFCGVFGTATIEGLKNAETKTAVTPTTNPRV